MGFLGKLFEKREAGCLLKQSQVDDLYARMNPANICDPVNLKVLGDLSMEEREEFALRTNTVVMYVGGEVAGIQAAEEKAALAAMPKGFEIHQLNGLNIGCGGRTISDYLLPIDIMREGGGISGEHNQHTKHALLSMPDALPFRENSVDFIVALHMLEHVGDPVSVIHHFLDVLKPGGGIGIVVPDWRYTWDARFDHSELGHKWNCTSALVEKLYDENWKDRCVLEQCNTYPYKMSFDFVLRKNGTFEVFDIAAYGPQKSGKQLADEGIFIHLDDIADLPEMDDNNET